MGISYENVFPSYYKIAGFSVFRHLDRVVIQRETYDILALFGDIGGLEAITLVIGGAFISRITDFLATVYLMPYLFYYRKNETAEDVRPF